MPWEFLLLNQVMVEHLKLFLHADETCLDHSFQFLSCQTVQKHSGIAWLNIRITWEVFSLAVEIHVKASMSYMRLVGLTQFSTPALASSFLLIWTLGGKAA